MESSDRYNPFVYIRTEDDIPRLIMNIFQVCGTPDAQKATPFWDDGLRSLSAVSLLFQCGLYLYQIKRFLQKPV